MPTLDQAIRWTVAYADVFDYPLTVDEIHWYLWGIPATREEIAWQLGQRDFVPMHLARVSGNPTDACSGYYTLPGREHIVAVRQRREALAAPMWLKALAYARMIAQLPFVRMIGLSGSLAMGNVEPGADIDFLIVTRPGRLWMCRAAVIALGRFATRRDILFCPNYFISENAIVFNDRNAYTAHEFAQMIPLYGMDTYDRMQTANPWVQQYLPNARGLPCLTNRVWCSKVAEASPSEPSGFIKSLLECILLSWPGTKLEGWEMRRKLRRFADELESHPESDFSSDCCKGHFNDHRLRTLESFAARLDCDGSECPSGATPDGELSLPYAEGMNFV